MCTLVTPSGPYVTTVFCYWMTTVPRGGHSNQYTRKCRITKEQAPYLKKWCFSFPSVAIFCRGFSFHTVTTLCRVAVDAGPFNAEHYRITQFISFVTVLLDFLGHLVNLPVERHWTTIQRRFHNATSTSGGAKFFTLTPIKEHYSSHWQQQWGTFLPNNISHDMNLPP